jgi:hypothetical protein
VNQVNIFKMAVHDIPGKSHCWSPIVRGKVVQYKGEPPFTVRAAKKAAAKELGIEVDDIDFTIHRG